MAELTASEVEARATQIVETQDQLPGRAHDDVTFTTVDLNDAKQRLAATSDPFFGGFGWTMSAPPGGMVTGNVSVEFPQPDAVPTNSNIYVQVWVGSGNVDPAIGTFLLNVDPRFPRLCEPKVPGLRPGTSQVPELPVPPGRSLLSFRLRIPFDVEPSVYLGNMCLVRLSPFSVGEVLGRAGFAFRVRGIKEPPDLASG